MIHSVSALYRQYRQLVLPTFVTILAVVSLAACDGLLSTTGEEEGSASFNVLLTDAPFPFDMVEEANVTITEVQLVPSSADDEEEEEETEVEEAEDDASDDDGDDQESEDVREDDDADENGIITLKNTWGEEDDPSVSFNLLELRNGVTAELAGDVEIPAGTYSQIRLIVAEEAKLVATDGSEYDLKIPSGTQTGVKIQLDNLEVNAETEKTLVLDFSLEDSFVARGNVNRSEDLNGIIFKPVVHLKSVTDGAPEEDDGLEEDNGEEDNGEEESGDDSQSDEETDGNA